MLVCLPSWIRAARRGLGSRRSVFSCQTRSPISSCSEAAPSQRALFKRRPITLRGGWSSRRGCYTIVQCANLIPAIHYIQPPGFTPTGTTPAMQSGGCPTEHAALLFALLWRLLKMRVIAKQSSESTRVFYFSHEPHMNLPRQDWQPTLFRGIFQ